MLYFKMLVWWTPPLSVLRIHLRPKPCCSANHVALSCGGKQKDRAYRTSWDSRKAALDSQPSHGPVLPLGEPPSISLPRHPLNTVAFVLKYGNGHM